MPDSPTPSAVRTMQCMEVWGGNGACENGVTMPGIDAWVLSLPCAGQAAGGDIHFVSSCGTGRISRVMVADVAGHGPAAADLAVKLRALMRRYVNYVDQSALCSRINSEFTALADDGRFATAVVATFWAPTRYLAVSNAGHPRPVLYSAAARAWAAIDADGEEPGQRGGAGALPLGIDRGSCYGEMGVRLRRGDVLLIYTDSLIEAKSPDGRMLGEAGLLKLLVELNPDDPGGLARALLDGVRVHTGGRALEDDATIVVLACNGLAVRAPLGAQARASAEFVGMLLRGVLGRGLRSLPWPEPRADNLLGQFIPAFNRLTGRGARDAASLAPTAAPERDGVLPSTSAPDRGDVERP